ncbi:XRE family transcriptional regulator [Cryobacterium sp. TMT1-2-2]|uniref:helix-turn-helix domain-containing protein n=1 Tax=Cryobacterium sp. TMT1-2-2 TaxID=1259233 RepID=UPI00106CC677|nr:helix-turn-helix transcriptional regulator [Cryobacterium sp. TMT1-2-2]TFD13854.1 XRE family transcriptional regulator [Cryobacterium sp. TMT1-2-2]
MMNAIDEARARRALPAPALAKAIREGAGVSQSAIARTLGVNRMTVSRWEAGNNRPSAEHLNAYADVLRALEEEARGQR